MSAPEKPDRVLVDVGIVARMFGVDAKTIVRWDVTGKLKPALRTLGGHRRYYLDEIEKLRGTS